jgi:hypothetical protein
MDEFSRLLMLIGAATPPGRLAASIAAGADAVRSRGRDIEVDIMNLAETPIDTCDGRPLDGYGAETRRAVDRIAGAAALLIAAPVYRASFPGVLKNLLDIVPVEALQGKPVGIVAMGGSPITISRSTHNCARCSAGSGRWSRPPASTSLVPISRMAGWPRKPRTRTWSRSPIRCCCCSAASTPPRSVRCRWRRNSPENPRQQPKIHGRVPATGPLPLPPKG